MARAGIGPSPGIVIGPIYLHASNLPDIAPRRVGHPGAEVGKPARSETLVRNS